MFYADRFSCRPPPNFEFRTLDITSDDWGFTEKFDVIHSRLLCTVQMDWRKLVAKIFDHLKPGGYVEMKEVQFPIHCDDNSWEANGMKDFYVSWDQGIKKLGLDWFVTPKLPDLLKDGGFLDVDKIKVMLRAGTWGDTDKDKEDGRLFAVAQYVHPMLFLVPLTKGLGWTEEEAQAKVKETYEGLLTGNVHVYTNFFVMWGRKPE